MSEHDGLVVERVAGRQIMERRTISPGVNVASIDATVEAGLKRPDGAVVLLSIGMDVTGARVSVAVGEPDGTDRVAGYRIFSYAELIDLAWGRFPEGMEPEAEKPKESEEECPPPSLHPRGTTPASSPPAPSSPK
jgi:hypothetical protein